MWRAKQLALSHRCDGGASGMPTGFGHSPLTCATCSALGSVLENALPRWVLGGYKEPVKHHPEAFSHFALN